jgi:hypothetical protein
VDVSIATIVGWIAVLVPAATAVGHAAVLRERVNRLDRSVEDFGKRIGQLEKAKEAAGAVENERIRRRTGAVLAPPRSDDE